MSEIADELERLAEEFRKKRDSHNASAERFKRDPDGLRWQEQHEIAADSWGAAAAQLRARAAELRTQRTGPAYKPQPKPEKLDDGQWWTSQSDPVFPGQPLKVVGTANHTDAVLCSPSGGSRHVNLWSLLGDNWHYLGDGPEPAT